MLSHLFSALLEKTTTKAPEFPSFYACAPVLTDLIFAIDGSASMGINNFKRALNFAQDVIAKLEFQNAGLHVSVYTYGNETDQKIEIKLPKDPVALQNQVSVLERIGKIRYRNSKHTLTALALHKINRYLREKSFDNRKKMLVIIHDGEISTDTRPEAVSRCQQKYFYETYPYLCKDFDHYFTALQDKNVEIFGISMYRAQDNQLQKSIAKYGTGNYHQISGNFDQIFDLVDLMVEQVCQIGKIEP